MRARDKRTHAHARTRTLTHTRARLVQKLGISQISAAFCALRMEFSQKIDSGTTSWTLFDVAHIYNLVRCVNFNIIKPPTPGSSKMVTWLEAFRLKMRKHFSFPLTFFVSLSFTQLPSFYLRSCFLFLLTYRRPSHLFLGLPAYSMQSRKGHFNLPAKNGLPCSTCSFQQIFVVRVAFAKIRNKHSLSLGTSETE